MRDIVVGMDLKDSYAVRGGSAHHRLRQWPGDVVSMLCSLLCRQAQDARRHGR